MLPPKKYELKLLSLCLLMCALALSLSACTTTPPPKSDEQYQESLLTKCPGELPVLTGTTGNNLSQALTDFLTLYGNCAARHNQLVDEINIRRNQNNE